MPRGAGLHNMSEEQLKQNKRERDLKSYHKNKDRRRKAQELLKRNAKTITCGCGGTYKDISQWKNSHERTGKHQLWDEEEEKGLRPLICRKINSVNTLEEAQTELDNLYFKNEKFTYINKELFIPKLVRHFNKMPDKEKPKPKPKKLIIKRKLKIIPENS